ncbi:MAG: dTDP-4-dehydrorhamnose 3,5-epimerase [Candidatus Izemoplasmatales bacterium]|nr:dTDP-4-dehydrorhamnose 3,5-epimerase [Candidatus Izemoplasmatales bacterium]
MKKNGTGINDLYVLEPNVFADNRGWFLESYNKKALEDLGININFIQDNHSLSSEKGVLRGLHLQTNPNAQTKLVRCTKGRILDVAVDLRKSSPTYLKVFTIELSTVNQKQLLIPKGFAHGFVTLEDNTEVQYKVDEYYSKEHDRSIKYNDPIFNIDWVVDNVILSDKDKNAPFYRDSDISFE